MRVLWRFKSEIGLTLVALLLFIDAGGTRPVDTGCGPHQSSTTVTQLKQLMLVLEDFKRVCGFYPTTDQGLEALTIAPKGRECKNYPVSEGFISGGKVPHDAWDSPFQYESDGSKYRISSTHGYAMTNVSPEVSYPEGKPPGYELDAFGPRPGYHILAAYVFFMIFITRKRWRSHLQSDAETIVSIISFLAGCFAMLGSCNPLQC